MTHIMILLCVLLSLFLCSCQVDGKNSVLVDLVSLQEVPPVIDSIQIIVNDGQEEVFFEFDRPKLAPVKNLDDERLAFVLDFAPEFAKTEVTFEIIGLRNGVNVLSTDKETAFVGRGLVQQEVLIGFCGNFDEDKFRNEECDFGDTIDNDGCDSNCTITACGNGIATPGEFCYDSEPVEISDDALFIASGDIDGDGDADLINLGEIDTTFAARTINLFINNRDESFPLINSLSIDGISELTERGVALNDVDNDEDLDIVVIDRNPNIGSLLKVFDNDGLGGFADFESFPLSAGELSAFETADLNGDNFIDIIISRRLSDRISVLLNDGEGNFEIQKEFFIDKASSISAGDIDNDGDVDLAVDSVANDLIQIMVNNGNAQFSLRDSINTLNPKNTTFRDINGDGHLDLITGDFSADNVVNIFTNGGIGNFQFFESVILPLGGILRKTLELDDFDNDGDFDLIVGESSISNNTKQHIFLNDGSGRFQFKQTFDVINSNQVLTEDLNQDGVPEIITSNSVLFSTP